MDIVDSNYTDIFRHLYHKYQLIGISAMTPSYAIATALARHIRSTHSYRPIIIGGVHISTCKDSQSLNTFDSMVIGEGEQSMLDLIKDVENNNLKRKYETEPTANLDDLTPPDWDLIDQRYFTNQLNTTFAEYGIEGWLLTSRGCPYKCAFCSTTRFWSKVRMHSPAYIEKLLLNLSNRKVTHIQIWDDLFTINKTRLNQLAPILHKTGIKFNCQPRINLIDNDICQLLVSSNVTLCIFGFESGNTRVLQYLKNDKTLSVELSISAIKLCRKYGLDTQGSVILGSPTETLPEMLDTIRFMVWCLFNGVQRLWAFVTTPFPATEFWQYIPKNFHYAQLSHHNIRRPLLLNKTVRIWQFIIIMFIAKIIENLFKIKKLWKLLVCGSQRKNCSK